MSKKPETNAEKSPGTGGGNQPAGPAEGAPSGHEEAGNNPLKAAEQPMIVDLINKLMGASFLEESDAMKELQKAMELMQPGPSKEEMKEKCKDLLKQ
jgi:hypothetical protein